MFKFLLLVSTVLFSLNSFAAQTYFSCNRFITGPYAFENQEFAAVIDLKAKTMTLLTGSSDPIFPGESVELKLSKVVPGGQGGLPKYVQAVFRSDRDQRMHIATAVFKLGSSERISVIYSTTEESSSYVLNWF